MSTRDDWSPGPAAWQDDLTPLPAAEWSYDRAAHLLAHAGFGGTPDDIQALADLGLERAVASLVRLRAHARPEARTRSSNRGSGTRRSRRFPTAGPRRRIAPSSDGTSMGVDAKPAGNRALQPVSDRFFYWLRATMLETRRLGYWWANRMLQTTQPLEQKMALLWHGHFATHENKVRDYRKMHQQIELFERQCDGQSARPHRRGRAAPRRCSTSSTRSTTSRELRTRTSRAKSWSSSRWVSATTREQDVRECARAFTGWYFDDLEFKVDAQKHDSGSKTFLGRNGDFDGVDVLDIIFEQPITAEFLAAKVYRFLVRDELSPALRGKLGAVLRDADYELEAAPDDDPPVEGLLQRRELRRPHQRSRRAHGRDDEAPRRRNDAGRTGLQPVDDRDGPASLESALGRRLGRRQVLDHARPLDRARQRRARRPDARHDGLSATGTSTPVSDDVLGQRLRDGYEIGAATAVSDPANMSTFDRVALERDEQFNTRISGYIGWEQAARKLIPTPRDAARFDLTAMVLEGGATTTEAAVDYLLRRALRVPAAPALREALVVFLTNELGTSNLERAKTYLEDPLRMTLHLVMSTPEYQLV